MKWNRRHILVAALAVTALTLTACTPSTDDGDGGGGEPQAGGSVTMYIDSMPATLNAGEANTEKVTYPIYGTLVQFGENDVQIGVLAESLEATDPSNWVLTLREGLVFSDGTPMDAEAVKWNWEFHANPDNASAVSGVARQIASMTAVDETTLEIELTIPNVDFDFAVADGGMNTVGSPTAMEEDIVAFGQKPVTAGPFLVEEFIPGERATLVRNPDYFDPEKPYLDELILIPVGDFQQRLNAMSVEENAIGYADNRAEATEYRDLDLEVIDAIYANGGFHYLISTENAPFDDLRVRQAAVQALDLDAFNDAIYDGNQRLGDVPYQTASPFFNEGVSQLPFDREAAQELFDEYADEVGPVEFSILTMNVPSFVQEAEWMAQEYNTYDNVTVTVDVVEGGPLQERVRGHQFTMSWYGMSWIGSGVGAQMRTRFYTDSPQNFMGYSNPEVDAKLDEAAETLDVEARAALLGEILEATYEDAPLLWTWGVSSAWSVSGQVDGLFVWGPHFVAAENLYLNAG